jgi:hypothetical protein
MYSYITASAATGFGGVTIELSLHAHDLESCGGTHHVAPEAVAELKAQAEANSHVYCFVLH